MREAWVSILANLVALVAVYSAFSIAIAIAQALGPATPINQVLTLAGAVVLGLVGISGALFKLSDWFARHVEIGEEEPSSEDAAHPARGDPQHATGRCPGRKHRVLWGLAACGFAWSPRR